MADQPTTPSGSRWEPETDQPETDAPLADADGPSPATPPPAYADLPPALDDAALDDPAQQRRSHLRGRAILASAATALTVVGGLTGFLIGHSTAGNSGDDFRPAGFTGQVPGNGQLGEGQQGPPQFGDRDGDHAGGPDGDGGPGGLGGSGGSGGFGGSNSSTDGSGTAANPT